MASDRSPDASLDQKRRSAYQQRGPPCACPRSHVLPLIAILSLGACGTTGTQVEPASEPGDATGPGTMQPPPEPEPPPPCIPIHESCVSAEDFQAETESLAAEYREHVNFENQWGLGHVKADYAYGHLSQIIGEDVAPGAGVTIGFIDSGIDQGHPDFDGKTITEHLYGARDETGHRFSHGTAVASVAAAIRSPHEYSGTAWHGAPTSPCSPFPPSRRGIDPIPPYRWRDLPNKAGLAQPVQLRAGAPARGAARRHPEPERRP